MLKLFLSFYRNKRLPQIIYLIFIYSFRDVVAKLVDSSLEVNEVELQLQYYINFRIDTFGKVWTPLLPPPSYGLNSITALLRGWV